MNMDNRLMLPDNLLLSHRGTIFRRPSAGNSRNGRATALTSFKTIEPKRRRSSVVQKMTFVGFLLLATSIINKSVFRESKTVVMGYPSPHQGRRFSLPHDRNDAFAFTFTTPAAERAAVGMPPQNSRRGRIPFATKRKNGGFGGAGIQHGSSSNVVAQATSSPLFSSLSTSEDTTSDDASTTRSTPKGFLVQLLTGEGSSAASLLQKPKWLPRSSKLYRVLPTWIFHLRPSVQLLITFFLYIFHTVVLAQSTLVLPFQLIPNDRGNFQSIGLDTLVGMGTLAFYQYLRSLPTNFFQMEVQKTSRTSESSPAIVNSTAIYSNSTTDTNLTNVITTTTTTTTTAYNASYLPDLYSAPHPLNVPWKGVWQSAFSRFSSLLALLALTRAYFFTGRFSLFWEDKLYEMAVHCSWMTVPMHRSLTVLLGHLSWIGVGAIILRFIPRPQPFFQEPVSKWFESQFRGNRNDNDGETTRTKTPDQLVGISPNQSRHPQWVWWAIGGYFVSSWLFNIADFCNSYIFPISVLEAAEENSIVSKLVNPEGSDLLASIVGYIAPCLTAPWWEEILYRGFLLPSLVLQFGNSYSFAIFVSGILFSIHHQSELAFLPLCVLGWTWATVYAKSKNLWTTILIHCMWNSRIFLGSWFGL